MKTDPTWLAAARAHLGTREFPGPTNNNRLLALLNTAARYNGLTRHGRGRGEVGAGSARRRLRLPRQAGGDPCVAGGDEAACNVMYGALSYQL